MLCVVYCQVIIIRGKSGEDKRETGWSRGSFGHNFVIVEDRNMVILLVLRFLLDIWPKHGKFTVLLCPCWLNSKLSWMDSIKHTLSKFCTLAIRGISCLVLSNGVWILYANSTEFRLMVLVYYCFRWLPSPLSPSSCFQADNKSLTFEWIIYLTLFLVAK
jgi:hypothetical protein